MRDRQRHSRRRWIPDHEVVSQRDESTVVLRMRISEETPKSRKYLFYSKLRPSATPRYDADLWGSAAVSTARRAHHKRHPGTLPVERLRQNVCEGGDLDISVGWVSAKIASQVTIRSVLHPDRSLLSGTVLDTALHTLCYTLKVLRFAQ